MERDPARLLEAALQLPEEARAALAAMLLNSLENDVDSDVEAHWAAEIAKRLQAIDSGKVQMVPWTKARRMISGR
jgi:putative addiction module component (TIGR02574 family)